MKKKLLIVSIIILTIAAIFLIVKLLSKEDNNIINNGEKTTVVDVNYDDPKPKPTGENSELVEELRKEYNKLDENGQPGEKIKQAIADYKEYTLVATGNQLISDREDFAGKKGDTIKLTFINEDACEKIIIPEYDIEIQSKKSKEFKLKKATFLKVHCSDNEEIKTSMWIEE